MKLNARTQVQRKLGKSMQSFGSCQCLRPRHDTVTALQDGIFEGKLGKGALCSYN